MEKRRCVGTILVIAGCIAVAASDTARAQCATQQMSTQAGFWAQKLIVRPSGSLVAVGSSTGFGGVTAASWTGSAWAPFGQTTGFDMTCAANLPNGDLAAAGYYGVFRRWNGTIWVDLPPVVGGSSSSTSVGDLVTLPNGDLVAGGNFQVAGSVAANNIARWDGTNWHAMGSGLDGPVGRLAVTPSGSVIALGSFSTAGGAPASNIARWDGSAWHPLGPGVAGIYRNALLAMPNGDVLVGGYYMGTALQPILRWNGVSWNPLPPTFGLAWVKDLALLPNGDIIATEHGGSVARLNGSTWHFLTNGQMTSAGSIAVRANGDIVVIGQDVFYPLWPGGIRFFSTTCPATTAVVSTSCTGTNGPVALSSSRPWIGTTYSGSATGFGPVSIALSVLGFTSLSTPLSLIFPTSLPNCDALATPDILAASLPSGGTASFEIFLPDDPTLVGLQLFHQFLQIEIDGTGGFGPISSSNGLTLTVGLL